MPLSRKQLFEALVGGGGVSEQDFEAATKSRDVDEYGVDGVLVSRGIIRDEQLGQLVADYYGVPFINLRQQTIAKDILDLIPEAFARRHQVVPFGKTDHTINIALIDPNDVQLKALLEKYWRHDIKAHFATSRDIDGSMYLFRKDPAKVFQAIVDGEDESGDGKIVDLIDAFFEYSYQLQASDIHIEPEDEYVVVRFRIDGMLSDIIELEKSYHAPIMTRLKVLARLATDEQRAAQDGKINYKTSYGEDVEIRISVVPTTHGEKAVMRLLSSKAREFSLSNLGFSAHDQGLFEETIKKPWGMILVTGPTGSGKTTTLYAALKALNKRQVNISTIEDPVEYDVEGINQIQVNPKTDLTFAKGLRSIVRQDPDIIMVGEIRDGETADIAVNAAMTGHLVLSTLHTNDAATAFPRLKDMGVEDFLVASTVLTVIAQRLVRKICPRCIFSTKMDKKELGIVSRVPVVAEHLREISGKKDLSSISVFRGKGCRVCHNTGYTNRIGIFEVLAVTDEIREAIMKNKNADEIQKMAIAQGLKTMLYDGLEKVTLGQTTIEEVLRVTKE